MVHASTFASAQDSAIQFGHLSGAEDFDGIRYELLPN
jgi:hypothetical protein